MLVLLTIAAIVDALLGTTSADSTATGDGLEFPFLRDE